MVCAEQNLDEIPDEELDIDDDDDDDVDISSYDDEEGAPDFDSLTPEQQEQVRQMQEQMQQQIFSSPDVDASWVLPPSNSKRLPLGEESNLVLGFTNTGSENFHVIGARGAIVSPTDYDFAIQNLTGIRYNATVQPEETNSLLYRFMPDPRLDSEPREFGMMVIVYYANDDNTTFATTFFNETVTFYDASAGVIDFQKIFMFLMLIGLAAGGVVLTMNYLQKGPNRRKAKKSAPVQEDSGEVDMAHIPARLRKRFKKQSSDNRKSK